MYSDIHAYTTPFTNQVGMAWITVPDGRTLGLKCHMEMGVYVPHEESFKVDYATQSVMGGILP